MHYKSFLGILILAVILWIGFGTWVFWQLTFSGTSGIVNFALLFAFWLVLTYLAILAVIVS